MEVRIKKCKSGNIWKVVNDSWSNSRAWGHETTIIRNSYCYDKHKVRYYNRTWESYTYQTCMSGALASILHDEANAYIERYKRENNIVKFKHGERLEILRKFKEETTLGQDIQELRDAISNREFDSIE